LLKTPLRVIPRQPRFEAYPGSVAALGSFWRARDVILAQTQEKEDSRRRFEAGLPRLRERFPQIPRTHPRLVKK